MPSTEEYRARLAIQAWAEGEAEAYLQAYYDIHRTLADMRNGSLLVQVINTLLRRMEKDKTSVLQTARTVMATLDTVAGRRMMMAAAVDVACSNYKPGEEVSRLKSPLEVFG